MSDALQAVARAADSLADAERALVDAVAGARADGATWQHVADVLGVSRQAAFKRFGKAVDPVTGEQLVPAPTADVAALTRQVVERLAAGEVPWLRQRMTQACARELGHGLIAQVWREVLAEVGGLESVEISCHDTAGASLEMDPTPLPAVGRALLRHEAGECWVHVVVNRDGRIAGMVIRPSAAPETWPL